MKKIIKNKTKGFTIVELIVVMAIIAILILIAVPTFTKYIEDANETSEIATANTVFKATLAAIVEDYTAPVTERTTVDPRYAMYVKLEDGPLVKNIGDGISGVDVTKTYQPIRGKGGISVFNYNPATDKPEPSEYDETKWEIFVPFSTKYVDVNNDIIMYAPYTNNRYVNGKSAPMTFTP